MTLSEIMTTIEGPVFRIQTNVASDLLAFQRAVRNHTAVRRLVDYLASRDAQERVLNRVFSLARQAPDPRYENSADTPLSVYLFALSLCDPALARVAAQAIAEARQCWWAQAIAEHIMLGRNVRSSASDEVTDIALGARPRITVSQADGAGEAIIIAGLIGGPSRRLTVWSRKIRTINELALAA